jgi:hypothetical protein
MDNRKFWLRLALAGAGVLSTVPPALGSGQVTVPPTSQTYASPAACLAALEEAHAQDRGRVVARTVAANGDTREVVLVTTGVERTGADTARYEVTLWYHHGRLRPDLQQVETAHSYERRHHRCDGAVMTTTGENGFTLSTFDPPEAR